MGTGKSFLVKHDDWIIITFRFFPLAKGHIWTKLRRKLKMISPHVREPDYCYYYYSIIIIIVDWNVVFQLHMPLLQRGTVSNHWFDTVPRCNKGKYNKNHIPINNSVDLKDQVQNVRWWRFWNLSTELTLNFIIEFDFLCWSTCVSASPVKVSQSRGIL